MLLVASETGHVYTFATRKLQPMIASEEGKKLIQTCLNANPNGCSDSPSGGAGAGGAMDDGDGPMEHRMNLGTGGYDEEGSDDEEYGEFDEEDGDSSNDGASPPNTANPLGNTRFHSSTSAGASGLQNLDNGQGQYSQPDYLANQVGDYGGLSPYSATAGLYDTDLKGSGQPDGLLNGYDGDGNGVGSFGSSGALQESSRRWKFFDRSEFINYYTTHPTCSLNKSDTGLFACDFFESHVFVLCIADRFGVLFAVPCRFILADLGGGKQ